MRSLNLLNLLATNARKGDFRAEAANGTIYLYDAIVGSQLEADIFGGVTPMAFIQALQSVNGDCTVRINSPGGDVFAATAMAQAMKERGGVKCVVDGLAASAASIIAVSGDSCTMAPGSMMMIHNAWASCSGDAEDMLSMAALLEKCDQQIAECYASKCGGNPDDFLLMMGEETWMTPDECMKAGLCDGMTPDKASGNAKASAWNLSAFAKPPKEYAAEGDWPLGDGKCKIDLSDLATDAPGQGVITAEPAAPDTTEIDRQRRINAVRLKLVEYAA